MWKPPLFETLSLETRYELVKLVRLPMFTIMTLAFPVAFYLMFGIGLSGSRATGGPPAAGVDAADRVGCVGSPEEPFPRCESERNLSRPSSHRSINISVGSSGEPTRGRSALHIMH